MNWHVELAATMARTGGVEVSWKRLPESMDALVEILAEKNLVHGRLVVLTGSNVKGHSSVLFRSDVQLQCLIMILQGGSDTTLMERCVETGSRWKSGTICLGDGHPATRARHYWNNCGLLSLMRCMQRQE